jgi:tRNA (cmo5U34)-methyltransferase
VEEIRRRFDADVERFSQLRTGQSATMDAPLVLELISRSAAATTPNARHLLDVGCGAGNFTLELLERIANLSVTLVDLSRPMLDRAVERISKATTGQITTHQGDIRELNLEAGQFDLITAAAVLHHLRSDDEWKSVLTKFHRWLRPGGSLWVADHIEQEIPGVQEVMKDRWCEHLTQLKGPEYCEQVLAYTAKEDSPRSLIFQLEMLRQAGFVTMDIVHKNGPFAAYCAVKTA